MRFNHLDLNLLVALDILLEEQSITRSAERLNMTQSAASGVLARLRTYFEDELLVQVGRKMVPTPYALELAEPVRQVLLQIRSTITPRPSNDPAASKRHFRMVASDYLITVMLAEFIRTVQMEAPEVTFELIQPSDQALEQLLSGECDLQVAPEDYALVGHPSEELFEEDHVCVVWQGNGLVGATLTAEEYMSAGHVSVGFPGRRRQASVEESLISRFGFSRRLEVVTHDFNTLPQLLIGTNRIATMHQRLALYYARHLPLRLLPMPVPLPKMREMMFWHRSMDGEPMHRWLRNRLKATAAAMTIDEQLVPVC